MRKLTFLFCSFFLIISIICSCDGKSNSKQDDTASLSFDSICKDSTLFLTDDTTGPRCHVSLSVTYAKGKNAEQINDSIIRSGILSPDYFSLTSEKISIPQAVDSFISRYLSEYKKDYSELYKLDKNHPTAYFCEYIVHTDVARPSDKYYAYTANIYLYSGGAHGSSITIIRNIDAKTGKIVTLRDIFVPGFEHELNQLIIKSLCHQFDAKDIRELNDKAVLMGMDVYPSENFIIGDKSVTLVYSQDEIAYHAAGEIRVELSFAELSNILKK